MFTFSATQMCAYQRTKTVSNPFLFCGCNMTKLEERNAHTISTVEPFARCENILITNYVERKRFTKYLNVYIFTLHPCISTPMMLKNVIITISIIIILMHVVCVCP